MSSLRAQRALRKAADSNDGFFDDPWYWIKRNLFQYRPSIEERIEHNGGYLPNDIIRDTLELYGTDPNNKNVYVRYNPDTKGLELTNGNGIKVDRGYVPENPEPTFFQQLPGTFNGEYIDINKMDDDAILDLEKQLKGFRPRNQEEEKRIWNVRDAATQIRYRRHAEELEAKRKSNAKRKLALEREKVRVREQARKDTSAGAVAKMTAQELGNNLLDIGNKALETGKDVGKKVYDTGKKAVTEGGKAALNWVNAQADATRMNAETRREIARAKNKAIEEQTAAIKAAQAAQAAKEAQVSQYLGYAPWLLGGGLAGAGLGSAIGSQYKNTLLGAILGGAGGVGLGGLGKYVYDKYVSKQASADVDYSGVERRAKFRAMLG